MVEKGNEIVYYQDYKDLVLRLFDGQMIKIAFYYPATKKYRIGGLYYNLEELRLEINHLPRRGYHITPFYEKDLNSEIFIFKGNPLTYEDSIFWEHDKPVYLFDIEKGITCDCLIKWRDMSFFSFFVATFEDGSIKCLPSEDYEHKYVFLDYSAMKWPFLGGGTSRPLSFYVIRIKKKAFK